jgi:hypothetical protein
LVPLQALRFSRLAAACCLQSPSEGLRGRLSACFSPRPPHLAAHLPYPLPSPPQERLIGLDLDTAGPKAQLVARLEAALSWAAGAGGGGASGSGAGGGAAAEAAAGPGGSGTPAGARVAVGSEWEKMGSDDEGEGEGGSAAAEGAAAAPPAPKRARRAAKRVDGVKEEAGEVKEEEEAAASEDGVDAAEARLGAQLLGEASPGLAAAAPVATLKARLRSLGLPVSGTKQQLLGRLEAVASGAPAPAAAGGTPAAVRPGTRGLGRVATAAEAAAEKLAAGESRAVEHVALADEAVDALVEAAAAPAPKRRRGGGSAR